MLTPQVPQLALFSLYNLILPFCLSNSKLLYPIYLKAPPAPDFVLISPNLTALLYRMVLQD